MESRQLAAIARRPYWGEDDARIVVEAWWRDGGRLRDFANRNGFDARRIARWAAKLKRPGESTVRFHRVQLAAAGVASPATIEIHLGDGWRICVARGFDADDLRRVLSVLDERSTC